MQTTKPGRRFCKERISFLWINIAIKQYLYSQIVWFCIVFHFLNKTRRARGRTTSSSVCRPPPPPPACQSGPINVGGSLCTPRQTSVPARSSKTRQMKANKRSPRKCVFICVPECLMKWLAEERSYITQVILFSHQMDHLQERERPLIPEYLHWASTPRARLVFCPTNLSHAGYRSQSVNTDLPCNWALINIFLKVKKSPSYSTLIQAEPALP